MKELRLLQSDKETQVLEILGKTIGIWDHAEIILEAKSEKNPYMDVTISGIFKNGETELRINGFYDGNDRWKLRFMPTKVGRWSFVTESTLEALDGHSGTVECVPNQNGVHGLVRVSDGFHFAYSDGTPYYPVGTTCYVWNLQGKELEDETLESLRTGPFNKIRFCVYPKRYTFNHNEPESYPFPGRVEHPWNPQDQDDYSPKKRDYWDFNSLIPEYFQHLDDCVLRLRDLNIEADLILMHPYDFGAWGFDCIPEDVNNRVLAYLVARLGAFRNIWWSFANEYDLFQNKSMYEWDRYFKLVQRLDPYDHLRSIHNCREFYDHTKPWVTHCSVQSKKFDLIPDWFKRYGKPVVVDECGYEGNIDRDWGNISPQEMVHRFWLGFSSGAYVGHGETYMHPEDVLWWSKGGRLHGESPSRIAFLRRIIEASPVKGLKQFQSGESFLMKNGAVAGYGAYPLYGLYYFGVHRPSFKWLDFPEKGEWEVEVIDTWGMTIESLGKKFRGTCRIELPGKEYMAIRVRKIL